MVPGTQQLSAALKDVNNAISDQLEPSMQWVFGQCCPISEHNRPYHPISCSITIGVQF